MNRADCMRALGLDPSRPAAIVHADDFGMCHGANTAFLDLFAKGALSCGSVMVPCPWFPEIAAAAADDPGLDLGVHLTLTSEWPHYRWGPLTRGGETSGLVDADGYFPRDVASLAARVDPQAAEAEMRAQIERALAAGIDVTHLDTHMGAALSPPLIETTLRLGEAYRLPVLLPRDGGAYRSVLKLDRPDEGDVWADAVARAEAAGMPLVDDFAMTPGGPAGEAEARYRNLVAGLGPGITFVALHPNHSGDIETIVPPRAHRRTEETDLLASGAIGRWLEERGVQRLGMRPLRDMLRDD